MKVKVVTLDNKSAGDIELKEEVFGVEVRKDILARMVKYQRAKRRSGTHKVKTRGEIRGTTAKPFNQKGSDGSCRPQSYSNAQRATVFGPVVRNHGHKLPKKARNLALRSALSAKQAMGALVVLDNTELKKKTKELVARLNKLGWGRVLIIGRSPLNRNFVLRHVIYQMWTFCRARVLMSMTF